MLHTTGANKEGQGIYTKPRERDIIRESNSKWRNQIRFIEKPNGDVRSSI